MKALFLSLVLLAGLIVGCSTLDSKLYKQDVQYIPASTNYVSQLITNISDTATGAVQTVYQVTVPIVTPAHTITNLAENPDVRATINTVSGLPIPFAGVAGGVAGLLYGGYRLWRNKKTIDALVLGIEEGRKILQSPELKPLDDQIVNLLKQQQEKHGVLNVVSKVVNNLTDYTTTRQQ